MREPRIEIRVLCVLQKVHNEVYFFLRSSRCIYFFFTINLSYCVFFVESLRLHSIDEQEGNE